MIPPAATTVQSASDLLARRIEPGSFLTLHYRLGAPDGSDVINTFNDQPATLSLGTGELAPAVEQRLIGLPEGARASFDLAPGEAFGPRNPELLQRVALAVLREHGDPDERYAEGDVVRFPTPDGQSAFAGVLQTLGPPDEDWALFDFNHPLAGQALRFEVHVIGIL